MKFNITKHKFIKKDNLSKVLTLHWDYREYRRRRNWTSLQIKLNEATNWLYNNIGIDLFDINTITSSVNSVKLFEQMTMFRYSNIIIPDSPPANFKFDEISVDVNYLGILSDRYIVMVDVNIEDDCIYVGTQENPNLCKILITYEPSL